MSNETQTSRTPSRLKFWLLRAVKTIVGAFLTSVLIGIATMFLADMGLLDAQGRESSFALLTVAAWIAWLIYLIVPIFRRRGPAASA